MNNGKKIALASHCVLLAAFVCALMGCDPKADYQYFEITNNSSDELIFQYSSIGRSVITEDEINTQVVLSIDELRTKKDKYYDIPIKPGETRVIKGRFPHDQTLKLNDGLNLLFIWVIEKNNLQLLLNKKNVQAEDVDRVYVISMKELAKMNWHIDYGVKF